MNELATESGHWYYPDGKPCHTIIGANGKERNTTLRDARKLGLFVGTTYLIQTTLAAPALVNWKIDEAIKAALETPRAEDESEAEFIEKIKFQAGEKARKARERGTALHTDIERAIQGKPHTQHQRHVEALQEEMLSCGLDLYQGESERSFAHPDGFGGKTDYIFGNNIADFKGKDTIELDKKLVYDEHIIQLAAYSYGLGIENPKCWSVFIGVDDAKVLIHQWDTEDVIRGREMFKILLLLWKTKNRITT